MLGHRSKGDRFTHHWVSPNRVARSNQNRPKPMNSPASFSPSLPTKEHVAIAMTHKHHPAVKNRVAMKKYSQLFLLYSQHAMVKLCVFYRRYPRCSSVRLSSLTMYFNLLQWAGPINQGHWGAETSTVEGLIISVEN